MWWHNGNQCFRGVGDFKTSTRYKMYFIPEKALSTLLPFIYWMVLPAWPPSTSNLISSVFLFYLCFPLGSQSWVIIASFFFSRLNSETPEPTLTSTFSYSLNSSTGGSFRFYLYSLLTSIVSSLPISFWFLSHPLCFSWTTAMASGPFVFNFSMRLIYYM